MIEPAKLKETARRYEDENIKFRTLLRNRADPDELDEQFAALHAELFSGYDCCACNNCCREYAIVFSDDDAERIAGVLSMCKDDFVREYLFENGDKDEGEYKVTSPCAFLESDGKCRVQECKPENCVGYPFTDQPERITSLMSVIGATEVCPVVFEILQQLKAIYGFKSRRR